MNSIKLLFFFCISLPLFAQKSNPDKVVMQYDYIFPLKTEEQLESRIKQIKEILPDGETRQKVLDDIVNNNKPVYQSKKLICENNKATYTNETGLNQPFKIGEMIYYWDLENTDFVTQSYILTKPFVVKKDSVHLNWTYTNEEKQIGAFKAKKAIATKDTTFFAEVWFTTDLPAFPIEDLFGVKGGIIEATFANNHQIKLKNFTTTFSKDDVIKKPSEGKTISEEDFKLLQEQKIKEANQDAKNKFKN